VSLLWPRPLHIHLFPGICRLESPHMASAHIFSLDVSDTVEQILQKLDAQLTEHAGLVAKHKTVSITLSDHFSVVSMMLWQDALSTPDEISNYARLCLEGKATVADQDWVQYAEFDAYQQPGIVYAFSQLLLKGLDALSQKHHLKLRQVLPISARVFFNRFKKSNKDQQIALLIESTRSTLTTYINNRMHEIDVEPTFDTSLNTINRLLRRLEINDNKTISVLVWSNEELIHPDISPLIDSLLPNASITNLPFRFWRNY
jgi:hypothetical protein